MHRRGFLRATASGILLGLAGCAPERPAAAPAAAKEGAGTTGATLAFPHPELEEITIADLGKKLAGKELSSQKLVEAYLARIEAIDRTGPTLRAVLELNPDAKSIAASLDEELRTKGPRGPLHGIPILVKDNLDTGDRMQTTAGSLALLGSPAPRDSRVVERLRAAGAVILGKTNLSEWANLRDPHALSGWSARGGLTKNPYALDRNVSGSSSGSGAAVAANLAAAAIGTETDGSIVSPSQICGLVGLKPTVGLVSRAGVIPIAHSQDTPGPMTRTVADTAALLSAIAGADPRDPATAEARAEADYTRFLDPQGARGARIGVLRAGLSWITPDIDASMNRAIDALRSLGAIPVELDGKLAEISAALQTPELEVLLFEMKADMALYLAARGAQRDGRPMRTLEDLIAFDSAHAKEEMPWFQQEFFLRASKKGPLDSPAYREARATCLRLAREEGIDRVLREKKLDAIITPTGGAAWVSDLVNGDFITGSSSTLPAVAGYPSMTVPCGATHGLPLGLMFFGGAWSEPTLLRLAYAYEQATHLREKPTFKRSLEEH